MALKLITRPTLQPITLAEAKAHLRVDGTDDDALITGLIAAAAEAAEQATCRALLPQTWELSLDAFPPAFELTRLPVASITSIIYTNTSGQLVTLASNLYSLDAADDYGFAYAVPAYNTDWPDTRDEVNAVKLRFVAGYATAADVPDSIKAWVKLQVGAMYEHRELEATAQTYPLGFADRLLDRYKVWAA